MKEQLLDAWNTNHRMNMLVIDNATDAGMQKTLSSRGGRNIYQQLIHIHNVRMNWLQISAKDIFIKYTTIDKDAAFDRKVLIKALNDSSAGIGELLGRGWDDNGKIKGFKKGVLVMLGYFISHESHHRGNILLTLKQSGEKIPDPVKWGLWEWGN